jgi:UDP-N-acetyl-D-mannosaminuronic acid dehydrogenase
MVKLVENAYRDVNIAFANEVAMLCERLGISAREVVALANRHPRVQVHQPGPGVGGHCVAVDPWFLVERFPSEARMTRLARQINDSMPQHVVARIQELLEGAREAKVAVLGLAFKANVGDCRGSPALAVVTLLKRDLPAGSVSVFDPHVRSEHQLIGGVEEALIGADLAVILAGHDEFRALDPVALGSVMRVKRVLDTTGVLAAEDWTRAGFAFHSLGDGTTRARRSE